MAHYAPFKNCLEEYFVKGVAGMIFEFYKVPTLEWGLHGDHFSLLDEKRVKAFKNNHWTEKQGIHFSFLDACEEGYLGIVQLIFDKYKPIGIHDELFSKALTKICRNQHKKIIDFFIVYYSAIHGAWDKILHFCAQYKLHSMVEKMVYEYGVDMKGAVLGYAAGGEINKMIRYRNLRQKKLNHKSLLVACEENQVHVVEYLLKGDIDKDSIQSCYEWAAKKGRKKIAECFEKSGKIRKKIPIQFLYQHLFYMDRE